MAGDPKPSGAKDFEVLKTTIEHNIPGRTIDLLEVKCISPTGTTVVCKDAVVDKDRVSVKVGWNRKSVSPISAALGFNTVNVDGEARMTIVGTPVSGSISSTPCTITGIGVVPASVERISNGSKVGELKKDLDITVTGTGTCVAESVRLTAPNGMSTTTCSGGCVGTRTYSKSANNFWTAGTATATVLDSGGATLTSTTFQVTDPSVPPPCSVTGVAVSPNPVQRITSGSNQGELVSNLSVNVSGTGSCSSLTVTLISPAGAHELCARELVWE